MSSLQSLFSRRASASSHPPTAGRRFWLEPLENRVLLAVDLALDKDDGGIRAAPGETVPYTLTYANRGDEASHGGRIVETVPRFTRFNEADSSDGWSCTDDLVCTLDVGPLDAGQSASVVFAVTVREYLPLRLEEIQNFAHVRGVREDGLDPHPRNNFAHDSTPLVHDVATPDLKLEMGDGEVEAAPGDTIVYKLGYGNSGAAEATGVVLTDRLPAHTTFNADASSEGWRCGDRGVCQLEIGTLAPEERGMATFAVTVNEAVPPRVHAITNVARISDDGSHGLDPTPRDNYAAERTPVVNPLPDLVLRKSDGVRFASPGDTLSYHLVYANAGSAAVTGVVITEHVPLHTTFDAAASSDGWRCDDAGLCQLEVGELPAETRREAVFAVTVAEDLPHRFVAIVNVARIHDDGAHGRDPTPWNNRAIDVTFVFSRPVNDDPGGDRVVSISDRAASATRSRATDSLREADVNRRAVAAVSAELTAGRQLARGLERLADDVVRRLPGRDPTPVGEIDATVERFDRDGVLN